MERTFIATLCCAVIAGQSGCGQTSQDGHAEARGGSATSNGGATSGTAGSPRSSGSGEGGSASGRISLGRDPTRGGATQCAGSVFEYDRTPSSACAFVVQNPVTGVYPDPDYVNVLLGVDGQWWLLLRRNADCEDGWHFVPEGTIALCPQACETFLSGSSAVLQANLGCKNVEP